MQKKDKTIPFYAMETPRKVREKTEHQSTIYWFSFAQNRKDFEGSWHTGIPF